MGEFTRIIYKWDGYYLEDCECTSCLYYHGKRRGCVLNYCCCNDEKSEAIENDRIKRKRRIKAWDM